VADALSPLRSCPTDPPARKRRRRLSRLVADGRRLALLLCIGLRTLRTWDAAGKLPSPVRVAGRVLWVLGGPWGIRAWLAAGAPNRDEWEARKAASRK
jgi:prophage regulatory protein